jgi:sulfur carrier protein
MDIELNGAPHRVIESQNLHELMASLQLTGQMLAVAVNREVVPRHKWPQHILQPQDRVDIVKAIGGG